MELEIPKVDGIPLGEIEGLSGPFTHFSMRRAGSSVILYPESWTPGTPSVVINEASLKELVEGCDLIEKELRAAWAGWQHYRAAQVLNRPPALTPNGLHLERIAQLAARLAVRRAEREKMAVAVAGLVEHKKALEPPRRRRGTCQLRDNKIWECDGRRVLDGHDMEVARFEDDGQPLREYLAEVQNEKALANERRRRERREEYQRLKSAGALDED